MFKISAKQMKSLAEPQCRAFSEALATSLAPRYPALLGSRPSAVRQQMVGHGLARARAWGVTWRSSLTYFVELMLAVAPDFDRQAEIAARLRGDPAAPLPPGSPESFWSRPGEAAGPNLRLNRLLDTVSPTAWDAALAGRNRLPLYIPPDLDTSAPADRVTAALPLVFAGWGQVPDAAGLAARGVGFAANLGLAGVLDGPLLCAVAAGVYGPAFPDPLEQPWLRRLMHLPPVTRAAALRARLALDRRLEV